MKQETRAANFDSQTIWTGDNLDIMRGMNSDSVDLIYLDPPFNSKANYAAPIGSKAAGAAFKDTWGLDDVKLVWHGEIKHEYPGLYALLTADARYTRRLHDELPDLHVDPRHGNAQAAETGRLHLPPLRPDSEPLSETADGFGFREGEF